MTLQGLTCCLNKPSPQEIYTTVNDLTLWTQTTAVFSLPPSLDLLMGDVCGGSSSVSMVRINHINFLKGNRMYSFRFLKCFEAISKLRRNQFI